MKFVSIIVIGFNVQNTIEECLLSICNQTYKNIEIIFVDDGSIDKTSKCVQNVALKDSRIRYIYQENQGANSARKMGFRIAKGEYCMFIDGDDKLTSNAIEKVLEVSDNYDFVCFDYIVFNDLGEYIFENHSFTKGTFNKYEYLENILERKQAHYLWNKLYKTSFLNKINFENIPSITMGDDLAANVRMGIFKPEVISLEDKLYEYRKNNNGISRKPNAKYLELIDMMRYIEEQLIYIDKYNTYKELLDYNYFLNFYYYVVRNKYNYTYIQKEIYTNWKNQNVKISNNKYIRSFINKLNFPLKILVYTINKYEFVEIFLTKVYSLLKS